MKDIPKILHLYWDRSPMSYLQTLTPISFHQQNPGWEIHMYVPKSRDRGNSCYVPDYVGKDHFEDLLKLSYIKVIEIDPLDYGVPESVTGILKSDAIRLYQLYKDGGVWSDFDVLWIKPIEALKYVPRLNKLPFEKIGSMVCRYRWDTGHHNVGVLFSRPGHPLIKQIVDEIERLIRSKAALPHQAFGVDIWNKFFPSYDTMRLNPDYHDVEAFQYETFYPFSIFKLRDLFEYNMQGPLPIDNSVAVHWFAGHKITKNYLNSVNSRNKNCTINTLIKSLSL